MKLGLRQSCFVNAVVLIELFGEAATEQCFSLKPSAEVPVLH